jgi:hypothetical protein
MPARCKSTTAAVVPRDEQLRRAKRAQRQRQRAAGLVDVQLTLPQETARKLAVARNTAQFMPAFDALLDRLLVRVADYAQLRDLAWNRTDALIPAAEAFALYERNWRLVDTARLDEPERELIERLKAEFGNGVING